MAENYKEIEVKVPQKSHQRWKEFSPDLLSTVNNTINENIHTVVNEAPRKRQDDVHSNLGQLRKRCRVALDKTRAPPSVHNTKSQGVEIGNLKKQLDKTTELMTSAMAERERLIKLLESKQNTLRKTRRIAAAGEARQNNESLSQEDRKLLYENTLQLPVMFKQTRNTSHER